MIAARQDAALQRAAAYPAIATALAEANDLLVFGAAATVTMPLAVSHQALVFSRQATERAIDGAQQAGVPVSAIPAFKRDTTGVLSVPDVGALAKALTDARSMERRRRRTKRAGSAVSCSGSTCP